MPEEIEGLEPGSAESAEGLGDHLPVESPEGEPGAAAPEGEPGAEGSEPPAPAPKYFSHDDARSLFSEGMNRVAQQLTNQMEQMLATRFARLQPQPPQPATQEAPLFPQTQAEMEQMLQDPWGWVEMVKKSHSKLDERVNSIEENFNKFRSGYEVQGKTQKVVEWLDDQCMDAIQGLDTFLTDKGEVDPEMYSALKAMVTGYIQRNKGVRGLNVKGLAKAMHDRINRVVEARYKKKLAPPPGGTPPPAKPKGAPSKPAVDQPEDREAAKQGFRAAIKGLRKES